ncbi:Zinc finger and BTB domain-containing protein 11 [Frankliniella fusca]|uniref:Zinc finger and BTB domain-containing protein 11 n=1 Tax=Frankliniella fusca TaxID=407009 RepID=A0AAE1HC30_9NEOP|nr:Zinc finger and BTB domain-containing protein 11 [Frankliniella fusca]
MGIFCRICQERVGDIALYRKHLKDRKHLPPFQCFEGTCHGTTFALASSLLRHIQVKHPDTPASSTDQSVCNIRVECTSYDDGPSDVDMPSANESNSESESEDDDENINVRSETLTDLNLVFEKAIAQLCMNLWRKGNVPGVAIEMVVGEIEKLIVDVTKAVKQEIEKNLVKCAVPEDIISTAVRSVTVQSPGANLKTKETQMLYFERHFGLIKPEPRFIRHRYDQRLDPTSVFQQNTQVSSTYMSISIIKTLTAILNDPVLYKLIHEEKPSGDGHLRSFLDGTLAEEHALLRKYPHTLRLVLNGDEVEVVNKLGTKTFLHKIMGIYYLLQNLPSEENARLRAIHVAAYGYSADFDVELDVDCMLGEICRELEMLQSEDGVLISVNDSPYSLRAVVIALAADTEGAHKLMGLLSPSAACFCRWCTVQRKDMHQNIFALGEERTSQLHEQHIEEVARRGKPACASTGVKRDCILRPVFSKFSHFPQLAVFDSMHDILKGVAAMEIKLTLHEFCIRRKFFSSETLNARIKSFPYGPQDVKNKPTANFTDKSLSNQGHYAISQTAAQTWCLLRVFVFLVSADVPLDNPHLKLVSLMKRISEVVFSNDITQENIVQLENLIHDHHSLFFDLYPPVNQVNNPDENQEENEDWDENFVDDPDDLNPAHADNANEEENGAEPSNKKKKRMNKVIRPINKHHQILHYPSMIRRYGPAQNYWCMRFEAKHKIASQYATTSGNFINIASSVADVHQISHAADFREIDRPLREELQTSKKCVKITVSSYPYYQQLTSLGLDSSCVVSLPKHANVGGFYYKAGIYVVMPTRVNDLPVFGLIVQVVVWENSVILMIQEQETLSYNELFGAYACQPQSNNQETRAVFTSSLPAMQSISAWPRPNVSGLNYLSCRTVVN